MVANTTPIFTLTPNTGEMNCLVSTAMAAADAMDFTVNNAEFSKNASVSTRS